MGKSIKFKDGIYLDDSGISYPALTDLNNVSYVKGKELHINWYSNGTQNVPVTNVDGLILSFIPHNDYVYQLTITGGSPSRTYTRSKYKGTWGAWKELVLKDELPAPPSVPTKVSQLSNDMGYMTKQAFPMMYYFETATNGSAGFEEFRRYCVNSAPNGITNWYVSINGAVTCAILQKANSNYLSFIYFSYAQSIVLYRYVAGTWYTG